MKIVFVLNEYKRECKTKVIEQYTFHTARVFTVLLELHIHEVIDIETQTLVFAEQVLGTSCQSENENYIKLNLMTTCCNIMHKTIKTRY